jgi:hypothetical protein
MLVRSLLLGGAVAVLLLHGQSFLVGSSSSFLDPFTIGDFLSREVYSRLDVSMAFDAAAAALWVLLFVSITLAVSVLWPLAERVIRAGTRVVLRRA